ncbi:FKBP-type peptidyl-prolyl cis-trans isomerase [Gordonia caeni]|uniref:Peptidyl-prolyl cis-trans isomerase n=1 Tax=Gordonia caeni TaxID=1007097 RepID=A0ABP7PCY0_9ACTN
MTRKALMLLPAAACALLLAGCSSSDSDDTAASAETSPAAAATCPTAEPAADAQPEWTVQGTTGSVEVVGQTDTTAPRITVQAPFAVDETEVKTLQEGDGETVTADSMISVCYMGVDGRNGEIFDSAYQRGEAAEFSPGGVIPGFSKALVDQKVGSTVAVVIPSEDGYPQGTPDGSIQAGDTIVFALKILSAN